MPFVLGTDLDFLRTCCPCRTAAERLYCVFFAGKLGSLTSPKHPKKIETHLRVGKKKPHSLTDWQGLMTEHVARKIRMYAFRKQIGVDFRRFKTFRAISLNRPVLCVCVFCSGELLPRGVGAPVEGYGGEPRLHGIRA